MKSVVVPEYKIVEEVKLPASKTAIIVVDMQNDFVHPDGKLYVSNAKVTIPAIKSLIEKGREKDVRVFYTQDWHRRDDVEFSIWGEHAVAGTWGAKIIEDLKPKDEDILIKKLRYDAFFGTPLDYLLRLYGIQYLVIVGTVANICVLHTASSAALLGYKVIVPIDGISAVTDFDYEAALRQIDFLYRGVLTRVEGVKFI